MALAYGLMCVLFHRHSYRIEPIYSGWWRKGLAVWVLVAVMNLLPGIGNHRTYVLTGLGCTVLFAVVFFRPLVRSGLNKLEPLLYD